MKEKLHFDENCIKLFVGQIPRVWREQEILNVFSQFGEIFDLQVLNDRLTGQSRGCAFLTFQLNSSAYECIDKFHGVKHLPGMAHPVQAGFDEIRPANYW